MDTNESPMVRSISRNHSRQLSYLWLLASLSVVFVALLITILLGANQALAAGGRVLQVGSIPSGCVGKNFKASITGSGIKNVQFYLNGRLLGTVKRSGKAPVKTYAELIAVKNLTQGTEKITERVSFVKGKAKTIQRAFKICANTSPITSPPNAVITPVPNLLSPTSPTTAAITLYTEQEDLTANTGLTTNTITANAGDQVSYALVFTNTNGGQISTFTINDSACGISQMVDSTSPGVYGALYNALNNAPAGTTYTLSLDSSSQTPNCIVTMPNTVLTNSANIDSGASSTVTANGLPPVIPTPLPQPPQIEISLLQRPAALTVLPYTTSEVSEPAFYSLAYELTMTNVNGSSITSLTISGHGNDGCSFGLTINAKSPGYLLTVFKALNQGPGSVATLPFDGFDGDPICTQGFTPNTSGTVGPNTSGTVDLWATVSANGGSSVTSNTVDAVIGPPSTTNTLPNLKLGKIPTGCVIHDFKATVSGSGIKSVQFYLNGTLLATVKSHSKKTVKTYAQTIDIAGLTAGTQHLTEKVNFITGKSTTVKRVFHICSSTSPQFTG